MDSEDKGCIQAASTRTWLAVPMASSLGTRPMNTGLLWVVMAEGKESSEARGISYICNTRCLLWPSQPSVGQATITPSWGEALPLRERQRPPQTVSSFCIIVVRS